jgi:hypothetical protein
MRIFKQVNKDGKVILTLSIWGDDDQTEHLLDLLDEVRAEVTPDEPE